MLVKIKDRVLSPTSINSIQITGDWHSLYTKGRIVLNSNSFQGESTVDASIKVGTNVDVYLDEDYIVFLKIISFNLIQETEGASKTAGDMLELILVSPWYLEDPVKTTARYGTSSQIVRTILEGEPNVDSLEIEEMVDPPRKRYQLGTTSFDFLETLRPYLTTAKSPGLLYNGIYSKEFTLTSFGSLKEKESSFQLKASGSNVDLPTLSAVLSDSKFYYNENKEIEDLYLVVELVNDLQIEVVDGALDRIVAPITEEILSDLGTEYFHKIGFQRWDISPAEQQVIGTREGYLAEVEFNEAVLVMSGINLGFNLGDKITLLMNKADKVRNSILSNDYIIKGLTFSFDEDESYTKMVVIPLIVLD